MTATASFKVRFTEDSARDLNDIIDHIAVHGGIDDALRIAATIEHRIESLDRFPDRGSILKELNGLSARDYRQFLVAPYRIIYFVDVRTVEIFMIVDGRRNFQTTLRSRIVDVS